MNNLKALLVSLAIFVLIFFVYFSYPVYLGQKQFAQIKNTITIGMTREQVLQSTIEIGVSKPILVTSDFFSTEKNIKAVDVFTFTNLFWQSTYLVEYDSHNIVVNTVADK